MSKSNFRISPGTLVCTGDRLGRARQYIPGEGVHERGGFLHAGKVGTFVLDQEVHVEVEASRKASKKKQLLKVISDVNKNAGVVLSVGQVVLCRVLRISMIQAVVEIVAFDETNSDTDIQVFNEEKKWKNIKFRTLPDTVLPSGIIRKEDIRSGASEEVEVFASFRPGDVILSKILSLGDSRRYFLTTSEAELGVIKAVCASSLKEMFPISWKEMQCQETGTKEARKVAKPISSTRI